MAYLTKPDFEARFGADELLALTDRDGLGVVGDAVFAQAALDAQAEVDVYLAARYALPLASVPAVLVQLCADIARYRLWADRASEEVRKRYEDVLRLLRQIASGAVALGVASSAVAQGQPHAAAPQRVFNGGEF